jgi:hypothetical protein
METIKVECKDCGATGLYKGFAESEGVAVICLTCRGSGCQEISFKPFIKRKQRNGIRIIYRSRGSFVGTGVGPAGGSITYQEFQQGEMP